MSLNFYRASISIELSISELLGKVKAIIYFIWSHVFSILVDDIFIVKIEKKDRQYNYFKCINIDNFFCFIFFNIPNQRQLFC